MKKLTIGTCVYDDYDGVYFTLQSIRINNPEILDRIEFIIINNNPGSTQGKEIPKLIQQIKQPITYLVCLKTIPPTYHSPILINQNEYLCY